MLFQVSGTIYDWQSQTTQEIEPKNLKAGEEFVFTLGIDRTGTKDTPIACAAQVSGESLLEYAADQLVKVIKDGKESSINSALFDGGSIEFTNPQAEQFHVTFRRVGAEKG